MRSGRELDALSEAAEKEHKWPVKKLRELDASMFELLANGLPVEAQSKIRSVFLGVLDRERLYSGVLRVRI